MRVQKGIQVNIYNELKEKMTVETHALKKYRRPSQFRVLSP